MPYIGQQPTNVAFLTDTFSGNGSTTAFTMSVAPASTSSVLVAVSGVLQDPSTYSVSGTTLTFSGAPPSGTSNISVRYLGIPASGVTTTAYRTVTEFTATSGQTTFSVPSYTVGFIDVYRNGVMLGSADYTATSGTTVVLVNGCTVGDLVEVISFQVSSVLNAIPATAGSVGTTFLADSSVTTAKIADANVTAVKIASGQTFALNGITFPATQVPSANANTLDDYEEGTFTPSYTSSGISSVTYGSARNGYYTKIGNRVYITVNLSTNGVTVTNSSAQLTITGLPFAPSTATESANAIAMGESSRWTSNPPSGGMIFSDGTIRTYRIYYVTAADPTTNTVGDMITGSGNNNTVRFTCCYFVA